MRMNLSNFIFEDHKLDLAVTKDNKMKLKGVKEKKKNIRKGPYVLKRF
jgi:hypothetical protein